MDSQGHREIINNQLSIINSQRPGAALLVVLFIVMAITILSLGFLAKSNVELACGENMILRTQMDYLAESGLEHAKGLVLNPQDVDGEYWSGGTAQQIAAGNDYYDVSVARNDSDPTNRCNYSITSDAYRLRDGQKVGSSSLMAELRLDPAVALWTGSSAALSSSMVINGDVYCNGTLRNKSQIDGDVFANTVSGPGSISGQRKATGDLSLVWPRVTTADFISHYTIQSIAGSLSGQTFGPYDPVQICYNSSDVQMAGNVRIEGMLMVGGDLKVRGTGNVINAGKNLPAVFVKGDMIIENGCGLDICGLVAVDGQIQISAGNTGVNILGGLFAAGGLVETATDSSGNGYSGVLYNGPTWQPAGGRISGAMEFDGADDYVEVRNEPSFDITGQITVAAWIKVNAFTRSYQAIVTKGDNAWRIQRYSGTNYIEFACTGLSHNAYGNVLGDISVNDGQWHHVAGVYNGSAIYLYVDGILDASAASSGTISTNNYRVMLGENAQQRNRYWNGLIDDVRVYNRGLSAAEINTVKAGGDVAGLVGHWRLDEDGGSVGITTAPEKTAIFVWSQAGAQEKWGSAAGAFFRSIERK